MLELMTCPSGYLQYVWVTLRLFIGVETIHQYILTFHQLSYGKTMKRDSKQGSDPCGPHLRW